MANNIANCAETENMDFLKTFYPIYLILRNLSYLLEHGMPKQCFFEI